MDTKTALPECSKSRIDLPRKTLTDLIARYGPTLCEEPRRCEALLRDFCGTHRREIHLLVAALRERVATDLVAPEPLPRQTKVPRLAKRLQETLGVTEWAATWAVNSWALALGVLSAEEILDIAPDEAANGAVSDTSRLAAMNTVIAAAGPPVAMQCPGCSGAVGPEDRHCPTCGQLLLVACPRCGASTRTEAKHCTKCGLAVFLWRKLDTLLRQSHEALKAATGCNERSESWRHVEVALAAVVEAGTLSSDGLGLQTQFQEARHQATEMAWGFGEEAFHDGRLEESAACLRRVLEADTAHQRAAERLRSIQATWRQLLDEGRGELERGQPKSALRVFERGLDAFPNDTEIKGLTADCEKRIAATNEVLKNRIPALVQEKKLTELQHVIEELDAGGVHVQGIAQYKATLAKKLESVVPRVQAANYCLTRHEYAQAAEHCRIALDSVADHPEILKFHTAAREGLRALGAGMALLQAAVQAKRWFEAKRLLPRLEELQPQNQEVKRLRDQTDAEVQRIGNYWRLLVVTFVGAALWLAAGRLAFLFGQGIAQVLEEPRPGDWPLECKELVVALTWGSQLLFGALLLPLAVAVLTDARALRLVGRLGLIAVLATIVIAAGAAIGNLHFSKLVALWAVPRAVLYSMAAALLITVSGRRLFKTPMPAGFVAAVVLGGLLAACVSLPSCLPDAFRPDMLTPSVLGAIVLWGLLSVTGLCRRRLSFMLLLPFAILLAYGLQLGTKLDGWRWLWPLVTGVFMGAAVLPTQALSLRWPRALGIIVTGCIAALMASAVVGFSAAPPTSLLVAAWVSAWAAHAAAISNSLSPSFQLVDWYRWRWSDARLVPERLPDNPGSLH